jgi:dihydrolipoamide dehydrogenase
MRKRRAVVIGAGSAGLAAYRRLKDEPGGAALIDPGPLGTTCARTGCMPSKALIHAAREIHRCRAVSRLGFRGGDALSCDPSAVLDFVRAHRDRFAARMAETTESLAGSDLIRERGVLLDERHVQAGSDLYETDGVIIATGSRPIVPDAWTPLGKRILTSETLFEQTELPRRVAVIGLGPIGLELGQALARLGIDVTGFEALSMVGGLSDPEINAALIDAMDDEWPLYLGEPAEIYPDGDGLRIRANSREVRGDAALAALGSQPALDGLGLENLGLDPSLKDGPPVDPVTGRIGDLPVFLAGDANGHRPVLHEALDDGALAADRSIRGDDGCGRRRVPMTAVFCDPEAFRVGTPWSEIDRDQTVAGTVNFSDQSRAVIEGRNRGLIRLYADASSGRLLGAEGVAPDGAHLAHFLALGIQVGARISDLLQTPFYHPTLTEALRTALQEAADQCGPEDSRTAILCACRAERPLA